MDNKQQGKKDDSNKKINYKLVEIYKLTGTITCESGLAIKDSGSTLKIGGYDAEVIKNPLTNLPYIPGSSLKGKMRSQLEKMEGKGKEGNPCGCGREDCKICILFGAHKNTRSNAGPVRIIVRDSVLSKESEKRMKEQYRNNKPFYETKTENFINRNTGTVGGSGARTFERVPAGTTFMLEIVLQIYESDREKVNEYKQYIEQGLKLVEYSYLGGSGSRGYGQVKIENNGWEKIFPNDQARKEG